MQVLPLGPEETLIRSRRYGLPQADRRLSAVRYLADRIQRRVADENRRILVGVQRGLASGHAPAGPLADSENAIRQFHAMLKRLLPDDDNAARDR